MTTMIDAPAEATALTDAERDAYDRLRRVCRDLGSTLVAFSAGVDSTLLLKVCADELGDRAVAATAVSESYPAHELQQARRLARDIGVELILVETHELADENYASNPSNRCYYCKQELFTTIFPVAAERGIATVCYGANLDDLGDVRPGMQAAKAMGARAPLLEAGLGKSEIRAISRHLGLETWDKPAFACLSSRIPYGERVTPEKLAQIDQAETALYDAGFRQVRVRHHGDVARIEVPSPDLPRFFADGLNVVIANRLREIGFRHVALDLQGYRSGSMNAAAAPPTVSATRRLLPVIQP